MTRVDQRIAPAICKHVDAIGVLLGARVIGIMLLRDDEFQELVCPEDNLDAANEWVVNRVANALAAHSP